MSLALTQQGAIAQALHADSQLAAYMGKTRYVYSGGAPATAIAPYIVLGGVSEGYIREFGGKLSNAPEILDVWSDRPEFNQVLQIYAHIARIFDGKPLTMTGFQDSTVTVELQATLSDGGGGTHAVVQVTVQAAWS